MILLVLAAGVAAIASVTLGARLLAYRSWRGSLVRYMLTLPAELTADQTALWIAALAAISHAPRGAALPPPPLIIEVEASHRGVVHSLTLPANMSGAVLASLRATLPGVRLSSAPMPPQPGPGCLAAASLLLRGRRRQLAVERAAAVNVGLLAVLQPLRPNESVHWQWIFTGSGTPDPVRSAKTTQGALPWWLESQTHNDADELRAARLKQRQPLLRVSGRLVVRAPSRARAWELFGRAWGPIRLLNVPGARLVRLLRPSDYVAAQASRYAVPLLGWPLLLNSAEFASLLALPLEGAALLGVPTPLARQLPPPHELSTVGTVLADSGYPGLQRPLALKRRDRLLHTALIGPTGTGKSALMINMALQDAACGDGLAVLDPKSDMVNDLLARLPADRQDDVIVVDPSDTVQPVGFNVLASGGSEAARELAVDHVLHVFHEQWKDFWGPRTDAVLRACLLVLASTKAPDGSAFTVCELQALLTDPVFRHWVTHRPSVPRSVHDFFSWFEALSPAERAQVIGPVLNKLTALTQRTPLRLLLGQSTGLDLGQIIARRQLLLMPLSRGLLGAETAALASSLMFSSLWLALLARARLPAEQRRPFWLYVDEASEVVRLPLDLADVMSEARGLGGGLTLAMQHLRQLPPPVRDAMLATVRSQVVFQVQQADAKLLARSFEPGLTAADLQSLSAYEVALRLCVDGRTSRPMTGYTRPLPPQTRDVASLRRRSRQCYGRDRTDIEKGLEDRRQPPRTRNPEIGRRPRDAEGGVL